MQTFKAFNAHPLSHEEGEADNREFVLQPLAPLLTSLTLRKLMASLWFQNATPCGV
jgi:hypothetical protein